MHAEFTPLPNFGDIERLAGHISAETIAINTERMNAIARIIGYNGIRIGLEWVSPDVSCEVGATAMQLARAEDERLAFKGSVVDDSYSIQVNLRDVWLQANRDEQTDVQRHEAFAWELHVVLGQGLRAAPVLAPPTRLPSARARFLTKTTRLARVVPACSSR